MTDTYTHGKFHGSGCAYLMRGAACDCVPLITCSEPTELDAILADRGKRYGKFTGHALITQKLKQVMSDHVVPNRDGSSGSFMAFSYLAADQREALEMIAHKIGRILNGNPDYADSWDDIAGYAKLVGDRLKGKSV